MLEVFARIAYTGSAGQLNASSTMSFLFRVGQFNNFSGDMGTVADTIVIHRPIRRQGFKPNLHRGQATGLLAHIG